MLHSQNNVYKIDIDFVKGTKLIFFYSVGYNVMSKNQDYAIMIIILSFISGAKPYQTYMKVQRKNTHIHILLLIIIITEIETVGIVPVGIPLVGIGTHTP